MKQTKIDLYLWEGKKWIFEIKSECRECDLTSAMLKDMKKKEFKGRDVMIEIKPWLDNVFSSLLKGGWHPPVLMVNGRVFSQGVVPDRKKLAQKVLSA